MRTILTCAAAFSMAAFAWGLEAGTSATEKKEPAKKAPVRSAAKKPGTSSKTATAAPVHTASAKKSAKKIPGKRTTWRNRQASPSSGRYLEIQNALVARGYLPAVAATGAWDQSSTDALKKFQSEQNLDSTGKINSLSLIALGLGPRHDSNSTRTTAEGGNVPPDPTGR